MGSVLNVGTPCPSVHCRALSRLYNVVWLLSGVHIFVYAAFANEYNQGDGEESDEGDNYSKGYNTPAALGDPSKRDSTETPPLVKRSYNFLGSKS